MWKAFGENSVTKHVRLDVKTVTGLTPENVVHVKSGFMVVTVTPFVVLIVKHRPESRYVRRTTVLVFMGVAKDTGEESAILPVRKGVMVPYATKQVERAYMDVKIFFMEQTARMSVPLITVSRRLEHLNTI